MRKNILFYLGILQCAVSLIPTLQGDLTRGAIFILGGMVCISAYYITEAIEDAVSKLSN